MFEISNTTGELEVQEGAKIKVMALAAEAVMLTR